jgi:hypothetical protein
MTIFSSFRLVSDRSCLAGFAQSPTRAARGALATWSLMHCQFEPIVA